jgi:predicted nucleic acid-binding protein
MTRYLLDTTALIDFSKGREPARSTILAMIQAGDDLGVCAINVAEFYTGIPPEKRPTWDDFISNLSYWEMSIAAAIEAGQDRYNFARSGLMLSTTDTLVAAVAREQQATLITNNVKNYPMADMILLSLGK